MKKKTQVYKTMQSNKIYRIPLDKVYVIDKCRRIIQLTDLHKKKKIINNMCINEHNSTSQIYT